MTDYASKLLDYARSAREARDRVTGAEMELAHAARAQEAAGGKLQEAQAAYKQAADRLVTAAVVGAVVEVVALPLPAPVAPELPPVVPPAPQPTPPGITPLKGNGGRPR